MEDCQEGEEKRGMRHGVAWGGHSFELTREGRSKTFASIFLIWVIIFVVNVTLPLLLLLRFRRFH